jgi:hypothetical protein
MRFWKGECSRAFTDWRGLQYGAGDGAWLIEDVDVTYATSAFATAEVP